ADPSQPARYMLPSPDHFARAMSALGVGIGTRVVVYDNGGIMFATRLWWMLRVFGFDAVAVLDGGFALWQQEGRPVTTETAPPPRATFQPALRPHLVATL